jgi:glycosyltransferase involved in cell wall biosynthesis
MDDVPPGPTGPEPRRPALSVVIPVHNGGRDFERCLRGLRASIGPAFELIVVDDGSTDDSAKTAAAFGARVLRTGATHGPASARNDGARAANAEVVFFLDADVVVQPDTLAKSFLRFQTIPGLTALFGSYDDEPAARGLVSQFRNLLHHFTHQQGRFDAEIRDARTFWTGCGAIRRSAFLEAGGFDPRLYSRPAIEDIELGYRLTRAGGRIVLARDVLGTHLKRWSLRSMVMTDIFQRGVPWMILLRRSGISETDLNVRSGQKVCVASTTLAALASLGTWFFPSLLAIVAAAPAVVLALNWPFYRFLDRKRGIAFAAASVPLHLVYFACCGLSVAIALGYWYAPRWGGRAQSAIPGPMGLFRMRAKAGKAAADGSDTASTTSSRRPTWTRR